MHDDDIDITVHKFLFNVEDSSQLPSQSTLLADATRFVISTTRKIRWRAPPPVDPSLFSLRGPCFRHDRLLADDQAIKKPFPTRSPNALKEWDEDVVVSDHELWSLTDLAEFDHSHLHHLLDTRQAGSPPTTPALSAGVRDQLSATNIRKRASPGPLVPHQPKRLKLDMSPLRSFLPSPHFYPPLLTNDHNSSSLIQSATWLTPGGFSPIYPYTRDTCEKYLEDHYTRLAWVVPIRGCLEWDGATSASIFSNLEDADSSGELECPPVPRIEGSREILWTKDALRQLWDVLKSLREVGNLGALSLSFYAVPSASATSSMEQYSYVGSHKQTTPSRSTSPASPSAHPASSASDSGPVRSPLRAVDHFKIYHDAPYSKVVRSALHGWSYRRGDQKVRLLKGARLVLVEERSRGLLLC